MVSCDKEVYLMGDNFTFDMTAVSEIAIHNDSFAEVQLSWFDISEEMRETLVTKILGHELDYDDQWYYSSIIIPLCEDCLDISEMFIYLDEFPPDENIYNEITTALKSGSSDEMPFLRRINLNITSKIELISFFVPSANT